MIDPPVTMFLDGQPLHAKQFTLTLVNDVQTVFQRSRLSPFVVPTSVSATLEVDHETYSRLVGRDPEQTFTVKQTIDLNPWHRAASGVRDRLHKARLIVGWEFQRQILRRKLVTQREITIPDCRVISGNPHP